MTVTLAQWTLPVSADEVLVAHVGAPARVWELADVIIGHEEDPAVLLRAHPGCLVAAVPAAAGALAIRDRHGHVFTADGALPPEVGASFVHLLSSGAVVPGDPPQPDTYVVHLRRVEPYEERERVFELTTCGGRIAECFPGVRSYQVGAGLLKHGPLGPRHLLCLVERRKGRRRVTGEDVRLGEVGQ